MYTKSGFNVPNVEICAVPSSNEVDLLMLWNRVFRQRNDQKCAVQSLKDLHLVIPRNGFLRLGNVHMGCSALLCCRFVDFQESRFQDSKRQNIDSAVLEVTVLLIFRNSVFVLQNVQIWTVSNWMGSI